MKQYVRLFPFLFIIIPLAWSWFWHGFHQNHDESDKIIFCKSDRSRIGPLNYVGSTLISNTDDSLDQVFCPGDYFGDLNSTYVIVKNCKLEMYHREKLLWSSKSTEEYAWDIEKSQLTCAFSLQRDGNLVLYRETTINKYPEGRMYAGETKPIIQWESQTNLNPVKTELRTQNQQMQISQTFRDGTERLFYVDQKNQGIQEDMGEPKKVANRFIFKKSQDKDNTLLRRNEYIGDLDRTHLILQANCSLQLLNNNKTLWSFGLHFRPEMSCFLGLDSQKQVALFIIVDYNDKRAWYTETIMQSGGAYQSYELEGTLIMFENDQPMIVQALNNGTELTFTSGRGQNHGLKLQRNPRQLAEKTLNISTENNKNFRMERMDFLGNLTDLHLIFGQNCDLMLVNGSQKLWELQPNHFEEPLMECSIRFEPGGDIYLEREYSSRSESEYYTLTENNGEGGFFTGYQLTLEDNQLIVAHQFANRLPDVYLGGPNTRGTFFQIISGHSVIISHDDKDDRILPKMGFIGDLNGVYAMLEENCNWVLYNKTRVIWESGTTREEENRYCVLIFKRNGSVEITHKWSWEKENPFWSTQNITIDPLKDVLKTELLVNHDGLWLINTYTDETVKKFRALEGTNSFVHVPNEHY